MRGLPIEGDGGSKLLELIRRVGYSKPLDLLVGTVKKGFPDFEITLDKDGRTLDKDFFYVPRNLTRHKRVMTMRKCTDEYFGGEFPTNIRFAGSNVNETMTPAGMGPHTHDITRVEMSDVQNEFEMVNVEVEYQDELREGDRVICIEMEEAMMFYILDVVKFYGD